MLLAQQQPTEKASVRSPSVSEHGPPSPTTASDLDDRKANRDLENQSSKDAPIDPYMLGLAVKPTTELQELQKMGKNGKRMKQYHEKQNIVCKVVIGCLISHAEGVLRSSSTIC